VGSAARRRRPSRRGGWRPVPLPPAAGSLGSHPGLGDRQCATEDRNRERRRPETRSGTRLNPALQVATTGSRNSNNKGNARQAATASPGNTRAALVACARPPLSMIAGCLSLADAAAVSCRDNMMTSTPRPLSARLPDGYAANRNPGQDRALVLRLIDVLSKERGQVPVPDVIDLTDGDRFDLPDGPASERLSARASTAPTAMGSASCRAP